MKDISQLEEFDNHELVLFRQNRNIGLKSFIAIHNRNLGPATGGTRYWRYHSEEEALRDVLKLSRAMTYKCALARVSFGGGKAVIMADPKMEKSRKLLVAYAEAVNLLNGVYSTGEDIGITEKDVSVMSKYSPYINGTAKVAGDLAPWAGLGVFFAMRAAIREVFGDVSFAGKTVAVKGLGKVGLRLVDLLTRNGAFVIGADINTKVLSLAKRRFPKIRIVSHKVIHKQRANIFAPCAVGGDLTHQSVRELRSEIVCGGANNQLASRSVGSALHRAGILYIPDYLANAGGLINAVAERDKRGYSRIRVKKKVQTIEKTAKEVIVLSRQAGRPTSEVADRLAESIFFKKRS